MTCADSVAPPTPSPRSLISYTISDLLQEVKLHAGDEKRMGRLGVNKGIINREGKGSCRQACGWGRPSRLPPSSSALALDHDPEACLSVIPPWVLVPYRSGLGSPHLLPVVNLAPGAGHLSFSEKVKSVWGVGWGWGKDGRSWT